MQPIEVESRLLELPFVKDAVAWGRKNPVTGQIVAATVILDASLDPDTARQRIVRHCEQALEDFKVPRHIEFVEGRLHSDRFKKTKVTSQ